METTPCERIPVTLIGGYLGAGKTSLLNHLLTHADGERIAVLVNDFGELGLDAALVAHRDAETVTLTNGCVCCSIADDFGAALDAQVRSPDPPARIVVETSGVADPGKTVRYALGWPGVRLDAVITVVDLEAVRAQAADRFVGGLVLRQIEAADLIVANKSDRVEARARRSTTQWIARHADRTALIETRHGRLAPAVVLGVDPSGPDPGGARSGEDGARPMRTGAEIMAGRETRPPAGRVPHRAGDEDGTPPFVRTTCRTREPFDRTRLSAALDALPGAVVRFKGLVRLRDRPDRPYLLQGVGRRWSLAPAPPRVARELGLGRDSVIDLIGVGPPEPIEAAARTIAPLLLRHA